ncbi:MAG: glycosyltransferase family 2 protein [Alphaproteobacteria bacterium]|nr:glycosyltransferase family 2 protein [Alphaproteobacteria bacterium]
MSLELTILMPCLNEAETLAKCIGDAQQFIEANTISAEVLVSDNGSTDDSVAIAEAAGARVVHAETMGYGAALIAGIAAARGRYVIMGDADDSYDFTALLPFLISLRQGADLVIGNRFKGGIAPGAMPPLHRYLGNPVLSFLGRLFFKIKIGDFHCGLRGINRDRFKTLTLRTTGMEFASEMIVVAALSGFHISEVPTVLRSDGRSRAPHLNTWSDGWRHLSFLLIYSPRWAFLYPGLALILFGVLIASLLLPGAVYVGDVGFDTHTFVLACFAILIGIQAIGFAIIARRFAASHGLIPRTSRFTGFVDALTFGRVLVGSSLISLCGAGGIVWCVLQWASVGFGPLEYAFLLRVLLLSVTVLAIGIQSVLIAFLAALLDVPVR